MSAKAAEGPKWRRRAEQRPDEILDAALAVFERDGFDAARVEDIAAEAGLSKAGVYLYFNAKDDILRGLIEREVAPLAQRIRMLARSGIEEPVEGMRTLVLMLAAIVTGRRTFAVPRIVLSLAGRYPDIAAFYRKNVIDVGIEGIVELHRAGVRSGVLRDCDSEMVARSVMGPLLMHGFYTHLLLGEDGAGADSEDARSRRAWAQMDILMYGISAEQDR